MKLAPFFRTPERCKLLSDACLEREGTPFREGMCQKGVGYDCAHFIRDVYNACGVDTTPFDRAQKISLNYGKFHSESLLMNVVREVGADRLPIIDSDEAFMPGDILGIRIYASCNHLAIVEDDDWAWHIPFGGVVSRESLEGMKKYIKIRHRYMEKADV